MRFRQLVAALGVVGLMACGQAFGEPGGSSCGLPYCGSIGLRSSPISIQAAGFGYNYTGSVTLDFSPPIPAGVLLSVVLNGASVGGEATTDGTDSLRIPVSGSSVACQITNPSTYVVFDESASGSNGLRPVLAQLTFNWNIAGC